MLNTSNAYNEKHFSLQREKIIFFIAVNHWIDSFRYIHQNGYRDGYFSPHDQYDRDPIVAKHEKNMHICSLFKQNIAYPLILQLYRLKNAERLQKWLCNLRESKEKINLI